MAPMVRLRGLIFLCLLHLCVQGIPGDVDTAVLTKITKYLYEKVQPKTQKDKTDAQYAIAIRVPPGQCTPETFDIQTVFSKQDATNVQEKLNEKKQCLQLTEKEKCTCLGNVIATRPDINTKEHAEHILLYPPTGETESPMDRLLAKADQNTCVVFYSYSSPCVNKCIAGEQNILEGLSNWKNKGGNNAFVFQEIWKKDITKKLKEEFLKINDRVPLYRCKRTNNEMECQKCVDNNNNVIAFCLP